MFANALTAPTTTTLPPTPVTQPVVATQPFGTTISPFSAVPATLENLGAQNNTKPTAAQPDSSVSGDASGIKTSLGAVSFFHQQAAAHSSASISSTTRFLTQLFAQGGAGNVKLANSFVTPSAEDANGRASHSAADVKYTPSASAKFSNRSVQRHTAPVPAETAQQRAYQAQKAVAEQRSARTQSSAGDAASAKQTGQANVFLGRATHGVSGAQQPRHLHTQPSLLGDGESVNAYASAVARSANFATLPPPRFDVRG